MTKNIVVVRGVALNATASATGTWTMATEAGQEVVQRRLLHDVPTNQMCVPASRANYLRHRCLGEVERFVVDSDLTQKKLRTFLIENEFLAHAGEVLLKIDELAVASLASGIPKGRIAAIPFEERYYALRVHVVPSRWPQGALLVRDRFLDDTAHSASEVQKQLGQPCEAVVVFSWFIEEEVPGAECGVDASLVITILPFPGAALTERVPYVVHRLLMSNAIAASLGAK